MGKDINIHRELWECANDLDSIRNMPFYDSTRKNFDKTGFIFDLKRTIKQLLFFFDTVVPMQTGDPQTSYYSLTRIEPKAHDVIYVNLTRNFPCELYDGHYCYIIKVFDHSIMVAPITSIKNENDGLQEHEIDVEVEGLTEKSRINMMNIRNIDLQRVYQDKKILKMITDQEVIFKKIVNYIFGIDVDKNDKSEYNIYEGSLESSRC